MYIENYDKYFPTVETRNLFLEDRQLSNIDFDYAFDEFKPISVKLLDDDRKQTSQTILHWSDIGGMDDVKRELIQTVQWRFEVKDFFLLKYFNRVII